MFENFKKKLSNAIQGGLALTENLPTFLIRRDSSSNEALPIDEVTNAGCVLLDKYEKAWENIRANNETNVKSADFVAEKIENIERSIEQQRVVMTNLNIRLYGLPELSKKLETSVEALQQVRALTEIVEQKLERLQILCDECDLQEYILQKQCDLSQYKQIKMVNLETHRKKVALEHERNIRRHEENLRQMQIERQAVFDDAFQGDLQEYRENGSIKRLESTNPAKSLTLEEVSIDNDNTDTMDALEDFLNG